MEETRKFNFQPYEIDREFDGKPHAFTRAFWNGEEREFALALVDGWIRFCEVEKLESGEWNYAIGEFIDGVSNRQKLSGIFIENVFQRTLSENKIGRLFCLEPSQYGEYWMEWSAGWALIGPENRGVIKMHHKKVDFCFCTSLSFMDSSIWEWHEEVEKWQQTDSDFKFGYLWSKLKPTERGWAIATFNGTRAEMEEVAQLIINLDEEFVTQAQDELAEHIFVMFKLGKQQESAELQSVYYADEDDDDDRTYQRRVLYELWAIFLRHFKPQLNLSLCEKYTLLDLDNEYFLFLKTGISNLPASTAHERLELRLKLAGWLQGKVPDDQINSLLA